MGLIPLCQLLIAITDSGDFYNIEWYGKIVVFMIVCCTLFVVCCECHIEAQSGGENIMSDFIQVFITINDRSKAKEIAETLLNKKLAACVQISGPATSLYRWDGSIVEDEEWLLIAKSSSAHYAELEEQVKKIHVYEVPEILAVSVEKGNEDYLAWLSRELK